MNRMDFLVGFAGLCIVGALSMNVALAHPATDPVTGVGALLVLVPIVLGLLAARAHDLGWPAWPMALLYLLPTAPFVLVRLFPEVRAVLARSLPEGPSALVIFGSVALFWIAFAVLAARKGQSAPNRYGAPT